MRRGSGRTQTRRAFWERYLTGGFVDASALRDEAAAAAIPLAASYVAAVFDVEGVAPQIARDAIGQALGSAEAVMPPIGAGPPIALFAVKNQADVARARQAAQHAVRVLTQQGVVRSIACGVGGHQPDPLALAISVDQARQALTLGCRLFGHGTVTMYNDLGVFALLHAGASREAFSAFADAQLEPLADYDRKHRTELFQTLRLYFDVGENVKEAAERLSVHRHTIFYRLNQISHILKIDLKSPKDQLSVRAALAIRQMYRGEDARFT
jgi:sugar diacid utilization regulator